MLDNGCELDMEVGGEPVTRLEEVQELLGWQTAKNAPLDVIPEKRLRLKQPFHVAVVINSSRPIMRQKNVDWSRELDKIKSSINSIRVFRKTSCGRKI